MRRGYPPSMGCDEFYSGAATGLLTVAVSADLTNVAVGFAVERPSAILEGSRRVRVGLRGRGGVSNLLGASHGWSAPGSYQVVLTAYNLTHPVGVAQPSSCR